MKAEKRACPRIAIALALIALLTLNSGCKAEKPQSDLPTIQMTIGSKLYTLEVADNDLSREIGLMRRDSMPADHGMIFVFPDETVREFWMKNTRIPLDILYLDHNGKIVSIKQMQPYDRHNTSSDQPAKYAIELNAGQAADSKAAVGMTLSIPAGAREPRPANPPPPATSQPSPTTRP